MQICVVNNGFVNEAQKLDYCNNFFSFDELVKLAPMKSNIYHIFQHILVDSKSIIACLDNVEIWNILQHSQHVTLKWNAIWNVIERNLAKGDWSRDVVISNIELVELLCSLPDLRICTSQHMRCENHCFYIYNIKSRGF